MAMIQTEQKLSTISPSPPKQQYCHFEEIFLTGCTGSCHFDNFQCSQWGKFHQNNDISFRCLSTHQWDVTGSTIRSGKLFTRYGLFHHAKSYSNNSQYCWRSDLFHSHTGSTESKNLVSISHSSSYKVDFLQTTPKGHPIAQPWVQDRGDFVKSKPDQYSIFALSVCYATTCMIISMG